MKRIWLKRLTEEERQQEQFLRELLSDVLLAKQEMEAALRNFNFAKSEELIDVYSYQLSAAQTKCNYLIRKAKENGITIPSHMMDSPVPVQKNCS